MTRLKYCYSLNGTQVHTDDRVLTGRDIRSQANLAPASDFVLIEIAGRAARSIGLEEQVFLQEHQIVELRSFNSDRIFSLTINERGFEWGAEEISAADIRRYAAIPEGHELVLDSKVDQLIADEGVVQLKPKGVERVRSRPGEPVFIIINTRRKQVPAGKISFAELVALAFPEVLHGPNTAFTVSFRKGGGSHPEGTLVEGETIRVIRGMIFNVSATDKS